MAKRRQFSLMAALMVAAALAAQAPSTGADPSTLPPPGACHFQGCPPPMPMGHGPQRGGMAPLGGPMPGPMGGAALTLRFLALTAAQNKAVKDILDKHRPAMADQHKALGAKAAALREAIEDPAASEAQVRGLAAAENAARLQVALEQRAVVLEIQAVLTPDQQAKAGRLRRKLQKERLAHEDVLDEIGEPWGPEPFPGL